MLVHDQPFSFFVFEHHSPTESSHFDFAGFVGHFVFDRRRSPDQVTLRMDRGIIIHRELGALVSGEYAFDAFFILVPTVVFQRGDIEKGVGAGRVELGGVCGIESGLAVPDLLQISFVGSGPCSSFLRRSFLGLRGGSQGEQQA